MTVTLDVTDVVRVIIIVRKLARRGHARTFEHEGGSIQKMTVILDLDNQSCNGWADGYLGTVFPAFESASDDDLVPEQHGRSTSDLRVMRTSSWMTGWTR